MRIQLSNSGTKLLRHDDETRVRDKNITRTHTGTHTYTPSLHHGPTQTKLCELRDGSQVVHMDLHWLARSPPFRYILEFIPWRKCTDFRPSMNKETKRRKIMAFLLQLQVFKELKLKLHLQSYSFISEI